MKTDWDYTKLADAYLKHPDYAEAAINAMLSIAGVKKGMKICDMGAGVAHLTLMLASRGMGIVAVEPNDAMRLTVLRGRQNLDTSNGTKAPVDRIMELARARGIRVAEDCS